VPHPGRRHIRGALWGKKNPDACNTEVPEKKRFDGGPETATKRGAPEMWETGHPKTPGWNPRKGWFETPPRERQPPIGPLGTLSGAKKSPGNLGKLSRPPVAKSRKIGTPTPYRPEKPQRKVWKPNLCPNWAS